jgi:hypothetical protein
LSERDVDAIFSSIGVLHPLHRDFLRRLEERFAQWPAVQLFGDIFSDMAPALKLYISYVNNYDHSCEQLMQLMQDKKVSLLLARCAQKSRSLLDLPSYMIMPVQRMPRYELLLRELIRSTSEDHVDWKNLKAAQAVITEINRLINEQKRQCEGRTKLVRIQQRMNNAPKLLVAGREFVKEMNVKVHTHSALGRNARQLFIFSDIAILTTPDPEFDFKELISYENLNLEPNPDDEEMLELKNDSQTWEFYMDTKLRKMELLDAIDQALHKYNSRQMRSHSISEHTVRRMGLKQLLPPQLGVRVIAADLVDDTSRDPYVKVKVNDRCFVTQTIKHSMRPIWNESFLLKVDDIGNDFLDIELWDKNLIRADTLIAKGRMSIGIMKEFLKEIEMEQWLQLAPMDIDGHGYYYILLGLTVHAFGHDSVPTDALKVVQTQQATQLWEDKGTSTNVHAAFYRPNVPTGYWSISDICVPTRRSSDPVTSIAVTSNTNMGTKGAYIKPPLDYMLLWTDEKTGAATPCSIWRPVAPPGYLALGYVVQAGSRSQKPPFNAVGCVHCSAVLRGKTSSVPEWSDRGSGGKHDIAIWGVEAEVPSSYLVGCYLANTEYNRPTHMGAFCLNRTALVEEPEAATPPTPTPSGQ